MPTPPPDHVPSPSLRVLALCGALLVVPAAHASGASAPDGGLVLAYIDPGSGSFILQALVAALAGAAIAINTYWSKIKRFLGMSVEDDESEGTADRSADE